MKLKPFKCETCYKSFSNKASLNKHAKTHSSTKQYKCEFCGKEFTCSGSLKCHLMEHSRKQLRCEICNEEFRRKTDLKAHLLMHMNRTTYTCKICKQQFSPWDVFKAHLRTHVGNDDVPLSEVGSIPEQKNSASNNEPGCGMVQEKAAKILICDIESSQAPGCSRQNTDTDSQYNIVHVQTSREPISSPDDSDSSAIPNSDAESPDELCNTGYGQTAQELNSDEESSQPAAISKANQNRGAEFPDGHCNIVDVHTDEEFISDEENFRGDSESKINHNSDDEFPDDPECDIDYVQAIKDYLREEECLESNSDSHMKKDNVQVGPCDSKSSHPVCDDSAWEIVYISASNK